MLSCYVGILPDVQGSLMRTLATGEEPRGNEVAQVRINTCVQKLRVKFDTINCNVATTRSRPIMIQRGNTAGEGAWDEITGQ